MLTEEAVNHRDVVSDYFESTANYWGDLYDRQDVYARTYQERHNKVLHLTGKLGLPRESLLLDIGCGPGYASVALARRRYRVYATDISPAMIGQTMRRAAAAGVPDRVVARHADVESLPFPDRMFALALAVGVIPWVSSPQRSLAEMLRVLRPGGFLIVTMDNLTALHHILDPVLNPLIVPLKHRARRILARLGYRAHQPIGRLDSIWRFDAWLREAGFEKLESTTVGFGPFSLFKWELLPRRIGIRLDRLLQRMAYSGNPILRSTGHGYIALCRRPLETAAWDRRPRNGSQP